MDRSVLTPCALVALAAACGAPAAARSFPAWPQDARVAEDFAPLPFGDPPQVRYTAPFFPGAEYDPAIPSPDALLGGLHGSRLAHHAEIVDAFRRWAELSPRAELATYAQSFEGRELVRVVIAAPENLARLDALLADVGKLADPRGLSDAEAERIVQQSPAVIWLGYSVHGDELSGADASLAIGYHLIAGTGPDVTELLDELVVVIDPVMNPDGRERILGMIEQGAGYAPDFDYESMKRGRWPYGRGNHYLFDMNRDWIAGAAPETRGRWRELLRFRPQVFVDAHELLALDTYLFYPFAEPWNPHLPAGSGEWRERFGNDQARAFDAHGWSYYTREWAEGWYPAYSDSWAALNGAIGLLYEQARTHGQPVRQASGRLLTYREAVHHQAASSLANLRTLREHRAELLRHFLDARRDNVAPEEDRAFVLVPDGRPEREERLLRTLLAQGVEVHRATEPLELHDALDPWGTVHARVAAPAGAWIVPHRQPQGPLVKAFLEPDPRYPDKSLAKEREDLQREGASNVYDVTAWSLVHAFDVRGYWCNANALAGAELEPALPPPARAAGVALPPDGASPVAWIADGRDDSAVRFAARALELGLAVHLGDEPFTQAGQRFARGSLLVRREENGPDVAALVTRAALETGVLVQATSTSRSPDDGPDLGGGSFALLARPRVAVLSNEPISTTGYGHLWYALDHDLRLSFTAIDATGLGAYDLRRYNVLVFPPGDVSGLLAEHAELLGDWVRAGGTLVACGESAAALTEVEGLTAVRLREHVLDELDAYASAVTRERAARTVDIDPALLWDGTRPPAVEDADEAEAPSDEDGDATEAQEPSERERDEEWKQRFSPTGVVLRAEVEERHWLTSGCDAVFPAFFAGSHALLAREPVETPVRLAPFESLRVSGLLWPEARERLADTAFVTVERVGHGQVILFAGEPGFRGFHLASARLFANAVVYGPGAGASPPVPR